MGITKSQEDKDRALLAEEDVLRERHISIEKGLRRRKITRRQKEWFFEQGKIIDNKLARIDELKKNSPISD